MNLIKLSNEDKIEILSKKTILEKRQYIQTTVVESCIRNTKSKKIILSLHPRCGKSYIALDIIKRLNSLFKGNHLIICPTLQIVKEFKKLFKSNNIHNVIVSTLSGVFSKKFKQEEYLSVFYDEADYAISSVSSQKFYKCLFLKSRWKVSMSGTYSKENLKVLESHQFDTVFDIDIDTGVQLGTLPSFNTYNLSVELTPQEKQLYYQLEVNQQMLIKPYQQLFNDGNWANYAISMIDKSNKVLKINGVTKLSKQWLADLVKQTGWNEGVFLGRKKKYNENRNKQNEILENSENKLKAISEYVSRNNSKGIVFTSKKDICDKLESLNSNIVSYHSDTDNDSVLEDFKVNNKRAIACVNRLSRGFTESGISYAINSSYNSKENSYIQKISRALSIDDNSVNKEVNIINLYCKEFMINNQQVITKDYQRLVKAQNNQLCEWVDSLDDI